MGSPPRYHRATPQEISHTGTYQKAPSARVTAHQHHDRRFWNASMASAAHRVTPSAVVKWPCAMDGCDQRDPAGLGGHQCVPGGVTLFARDIAKALRRVGGAAVPRSELLSL